MTRKKKKDEQMVQVEEEKTRELLENLKASGKAHFAESDEYHNEFLERVKKENNR